MRTQSINSASFHEIMSDIIRFSPSLRVLSSRAITAANPRDPLRELSIFGANYHNQLIKKVALPGKFLDFHLQGESYRLGGKFRVINALSQEGSLQEVDDDLPISFELRPIYSESQFDRVIAEAQQLEESVIIVWMANWCRKCIYLKPKLEKLAAEYHRRLQVFCVDVNNVPHKLVSRAGVTKMPTIQLWKDGEKQAEVIGGHKAYMVVNEVREMIENEGTM